jgi:hypothetical protein
MSNAVTRKYEREEVISLLSKNVCNVVFTKRDGSKRDMVCTRRPDMLPPVKKTEPAKSGSANPRPENVIVAFDLDKDAWRSFDLDTILSLEIKENYVE